MRLNIAIPENQVKKPVLDAGLEAVTRLNESLIREGAPTFQEAGANVRWKPEPPGGEFFDHVGKVLGRGHGDCDDLAPWHAASLRATGEDRGAQAIVKKSGPKKWHAVVQRSDGSIEDPSISAGMPGRLRDGARAPILHPMVEGCSSVSGMGVMPNFAARPVLDEYGEIVGFDARVDIPWNHEEFDNDVAMATLHSAPIASQAIVGALSGGIQIAEHSGLVDDDTIDRVAAIRDYVEGLESGADEDEILDYLESQYGPEHAHAASVVGAGFFKSLGRIVKKVALPVLSKVVQFIPGVGPVASTALDMGLKGVDAAIKAGGKRKRRHAGPTSPLTVHSQSIPMVSNRGSGNAIYEPTAQECARIIARHYGVVSGDEYEDDEDDYDGVVSDVGKMKFGKIFKHIMMPHTILTDRMPKGLSRVLDPTGFVHDSGHQSRRARRRRARRAH